MKTLDLHASKICYDEYDIDKKPELKAFLKIQNLEKVLEQVARDVTLVLGWDGTMLRAIQENYKEERVFLGINFGHKGFLLNDKTWIWNTDFITREYPLIDIKKDGENIGTWFNDLNLYSPNGKLIELDISNGFGSIHLRGDGAIVSTPAGSTWHSKSYGWPVLLHNTPSFIITPKWNLTPQAAKVIPDSHRVSLQNLGRKFEIWINIDGVQVYQSQLWEDISLEVSKSSQKVELLIAERHVWNWDNKLMEEQGFNS